MAIRRPVLTTKESDDGTISGLALERQDTRPGGAQSRGFAISNADCCRPPIHRAERHPFHQRRLTELAGMEQGAVPARNLPAPLQRPAKAARLRTRPYLEIDSSEPSAVTGTEVSKRAGLRGGAKPSPC